MKHILPKNVSTVLMVLYQFLFAGKALDLLIFLFLLILKGSININGFTFSWLPVMCSKGILGGLYDTVD